MDSSDVLVGLARKLREAQREVLQNLEAAGVRRGPAAEPARDSEAVALPDPLSGGAPSSTPEPAPVAASLAASQLGVERLAPPLATLQPSTLLLAAPLTAVALLAPVEEAASVAPPLQFPEISELSALAALSLPAPEPEPSAAEPEPQPQLPDPVSAGRIPTPEPSFSPAAPPATPREDLAALPTAIPEPPSVRSIEPGQPALTLAPLQDSSSIGRRIRPAKPSVEVLRADPGPRITLPGPALPKALQSLEEAGISKILVDRPKDTSTRSRRWIAGALAAGILLICFVAIDLYNAPRSAASVTPPAVQQQTPAPAPTPAPSPAPPAPGSPSSYPLSKSVEVTGLRFVGDKNPEVHYLVVNHSPAELSAVTVYVTIRNGPSKPPLYHFSFRAPKLGPFESKEMVASIDKIVHSAADWQNLHADVEVGQ